MDDWRREKAALEKKVPHMRCGAKPTRGCSWRTSCVQARTGLRNLRLRSTCGPGEPAHRCCAKRRIDVSHPQSLSPMHSRARRSGRRRRVGYRRAPSWISIAADSELSLAGLQADRGAGGSAMERLKLALAQKQQEAESLRTQLCVACCVVRCVTGRQARARAQPGVHCHRAGQHGGPQRGAAAADRAVGIGGCAECRGVGVGVDGLLTGTARGAQQLPAADVRREGRAG